MVREGLSIEVAIEGTRNDQKKPAINRAGDTEFLVQQMQRPQKDEKVRTGKGVGEKLRETGSSHITKGTESQNSAFGLYSKVKCKQKNTIEEDDNASKDILGNI